MNNDKTIGKILLIEDDLDLVKMLKTFFEINSFELNFLSDPSISQIIPQIISYNPNLILLDMDLPHTNGLEIAKKINEDENAKKYPIFFLTGRKELELKLQSFSLGVHDYVTKPFEKEELLARVMRTLSQIKSSSNVLTFGKIDINIETRSVTNNLSNELLFLSQIEFNLLVYFAKNKDEILTRDNLIENVWQGTPHMSSRVVDVHISSLRKKVKDADISINSIYGKGYQIIFN